MPGKTVKFECEEWFEKSALEWANHHGIPAKLAPATKALAYKQLAYEKQKAQYTAELFRLHRRVHHLEQLLTPEQRAAIRFSDDPDNAKPPDS